MIEDGPFTTALQMKGHKYSQQYSQIYFCRLQALMDNRCVLLLKENGLMYRIPSLVDRILDLKASEKSGSSIVFGTIFADLPGKPQVLQDLEGDVR